MGKNRFFFWCDVNITSFCPKNRQNDVIWRQKSIPVKMLQMGWNFDTSSKIRPKAKKSTQESLWRNFYGRLSEKNTKKWRHHEKKIRFLNYKYFFTTFGQVLAPQDHFWELMPFFIFHLFCIRSTWKLMIFSFLWKRHKFWNLASTGLKICQKV